MHIDEPPSREEFWWVVYVGGKPEPALVNIENGERRQVWLTGSDIPAMPNEMHFIERLYPPALEALPDPDAAEEYDRCRCRPRTQMRARREAEYV